MLWILYGQKLYTWTKKKNPRRSIFHLSGSNILSRFLTLLNKIYVSLTAVIKIFNMFRNHWLCKSHDTTFLDVLKNTTVITTHSQCQLMIENVDIFGENKSLPVPTEIGFLSILCMTKTIQLSLSVEINKLTNANLLI